MQTGVTCISVSMRLLGLMARRRALGADSTIPKRRTRAFRCLIQYSRRGPTSTMNFCGAMACRVLFCMLRSTNHAASPLRPTTFRTCGAVLRVSRKTRTNSGGGSNTLRAFTPSKVSLPTPIRQLSPIPKSFGSISRTLCRLSVRRNTLRSSL